MNALLTLLMFLLAVSVEAQVIAVPAHHIGLLQWGCNDAAGATNQFMIQRSSVAPCPSAENMQNETQHLNYFGFSVRSLKCTVQTSPAAGSDWTFTVRVGGVSSSLACTIANPATACGPVQGHVAVNADQGLSMLWSETGVGIDGASAQCNMLVELQP